jgi:hypothetical protein
MIARVAVVPQPPLLVPELVAGHDPDAQVVRDECLAVATRLAAAASSWVAIAVADVAEPTAVGPHAAGTFRGFGVDVRVRLSANDGTDPVDPAMPLPVLIAGWLRERAGAEQVRAWLVPPDLSPADCQEFGERLVAGSDTAFPNLARWRSASERVGLLVIGDGSHRHGERAVGRPDERAPAFDEEVHRALAAADPAALLEIDPALAGSLGAAGRAAWQILSGVIGKDGRTWHCGHSRLLIPFGVAYHLAVWDPAA